MLLQGLQGGIKSHKKPLRNNLFHKTHFGRHRRRRVAGRAPAGKKKKKNKILGQSLWKLDSVFVPLTAESHSCHSHMLPVLADAASSPTNTHHLAVPEANHANQRQRLHIYSTYKNLIMIAQWCYCGQ